LVVKQSASRILFLEEQIASLQREMEAKTRIQEVVTGKRLEAQTIIENGRAVIPGMSIR
jgi:hypothetical protein